MQACDALRRPFCAAFGVDKPTTQPRPSRLNALRSQRATPQVQRFLGIHSAALSSPSWLRSLAMLAALALSLVISAQGADARLKNEWKFGGSLARTFMALPGAASVFGDMSGLGGLSTFDNPMLPTVVQPTGGSLGELFGRRGVVGGFAAGFLGAGVLGVLFGHGLYSELSGVASALGLIFQLTLIALLGRLIWTWWRADRADAVVDLSPRQLADVYGRARHEAQPHLDAPADADCRVPGNELLIKRSGRG
jgi:hypothetical protein